MNHFFSKLKAALTKTSNKISIGIDHIFLKRKLDEETLTELEDLLISADIGPKLATYLIDNIKSAKYDTEVTPEAIKHKLSSLINDVLSKNSTPFHLHKDKLNILLFCGVNGNGKTTMIGKLAAKFKNDGLKVAVAACDTFRAAAIEQLTTWANNAGVSLIKGEKGADPASIAYTATIQSINNGIDILLIDTAGRLHNYKNLMDELEKIIKVIKKVDSSAPHHSLLVIDATTGQNAYNQIEQFNPIANLTGLIITKLDGTAKAGVVVGIVQKFAVPVQFISIGEKIDDWRYFDSELFSQALIKG